MVRGNLEILSVANYICKLDDALRSLSALTHRRFRSLVSQLRLRCPLSQVPNR
jgi:hypothetical protein